MKWIGAHVSIAGGVENAPLNARRIGADAFAMFTRNQRQWSAPPLAPERIQAFRDNLSQCGYTPEQVLPHDSYLINLGHPEAAAWEKSLAAFVDEMTRCHQLGLRFLNFHPGSRLDQGDDERCLDRIARAVNLALARVPAVVAVIENTAGQGSAMGHDFAHLAGLIQRIDDKSRVGVCLDTCHLFAAGYDLAGDTVGVLDRFDREVGIGYLRAMHLNDAKAGLNSRLDRHQSLGRGHLGWETFRRLMVDPRLEGMPLVLETVDEALWPEEIRQLKEMVSQANVLKLQ